MQPHGMSGPELNAHWCSVVYETALPSRRSDLWWATTDKNTSRDAIATVWKRITWLQREHRLPQYSVVVFEGAGGCLHAHITFIGNSDIAQSLRGSTVFGSIIKVAPVTNPDGLVREYLAIGGGRATADELHRVFEKTLHTRASRRRTQGHRLQERGGAP
jgi:hypothetical protein